LYVEWKNAMSNKYISIIIVTGLLFLISSNTHSSSIKKDLKLPQDKRDYKLLQENCGKGCEELFQKKYNADNKSFPHIDKSFSYKHHYNKKLNKCFILIIETGKNNSYERRRIIDIHKKDTHYGLFSIIGNDIRSCSFLNKTCESEEEWNSLIEPYMEE
jgi:hypothetical protein